MPIESTLRDGIIFTELSGEIDYEQVVKYIDFIASLKGKLPCRYELHDHTNTERLNFKADDVRSIAACSIKTKNIFKHSFLAIYAPNDFTFGIARMFQAFYDIDNNPIHAGIFKDKEDAMQFLEKHMKSMSASGIDE